MNWVGERAGIWLAQTEGGAASARAGAGGGALAARCAALTWGSRRAPRRGFLAPTSLDGGRLAQHLILLGVLTRRGVGGK